MPQGLTTSTKHCVYLLEVINMEGITKFKASMLKNRYSTRSLFIAVKGTGSSRLYNHLINSDSPIKVCHANNFDYDEKNNMYLINDEQGQGLETLLMDIITDGNLQQPDVLICDVRSPKALEAIINSCASHFSDVTVIYNPESQYFGRMVRGGEVKCFKWGDALGRVNYGPTVCCRPVNTRNLASFLGLSDHASFRTSVASDAKLLLERKISLSGLRAINYVSSGNAIVRLLFSIAVAKEAEE